LAACRPLPIVRHGDGTPDASEIGGWVHVFDPVAYAASLLVIVRSCVPAVSVPARRAACLDPIATFRQD
jgi:hypothetical protein